MGLSEISTYANEYEVNVQPLVAARTRRVGNQTCVVDLVELSEDCITIGEKSIELDLLTKELLIAVTEGQRLPIKRISPILTAASLRNHYYRLRMAQYNTDPNGFIRAGINNTDWGIRETHNGVQLHPINILDYLRGLGETENWLLHTGFIRPEHFNEPTPRYALPVFNNIHNLQTLGVFGDPQPDFATHIRPLSSTASAMSRGGIAVRLLLDPETISKYRGVYTDIEMHNNHGGEIPDWARGDYPGASFIILGGIPAQAIEGFEIVKLDHYKIEE